MYLPEAVLGALNDLVRFGGNDVSVSLSEISHIPVLPRTANCYRTSAEKN